MSAELDRLICALLASGATSEEQCGILRAANDYADVESRRRADVQYASGVRDGGRFGVVLIMIASALIGIGALSINGLMTASAKAVIGACP